MALYRLGHCASPIINFLQKHKLLFIKSDSSNTLCSSCQVEKFTKPPFHFLKTNPLQFFIKLFVVYGFCNKKFKFFPRFNKLKIQYKIVVKSRVIKRWVAKGFPVVLCMEKSKKITACYNDPPVLGHEPSITI